MEALLNRYRDITVLALLIIGQLLLIAVQVKGEQDMRLIRVWAVTAVTPVARVLEGVRSSTLGVFRDYIGLRGARDENRQLRAELGKLKLDNQYLRTELESAERARALGAFQARTPSRTLPARVIATGTGANAKVVFIDRGANSGVVKGMAVITPDGIVGKVMASYLTAAQVLLITDPSFAAGVISQKHRVPGTIKGQGHGTCLVDYVQNEQPVEVGEVFYTSGDDRVFPKGLPVGEVKVVRNASPFKQIFVVPSGLQSGLEEVLVVLEGVHGTVPTKQQEVPGVYLLPQPPVDPNSQSSVPKGSGTAADQLLQHYKRVVEAQGHTPGAGAPGSRPPNFNIDPNKVTPRPPAPKPAVPPTDETPKPQPVKPAVPPSEPTTGQPAPQTGPR